jgi:hypothetical protein
MNRWRWRLVALFLSVLMMPLQLNGAIFEMQNEDVIVGELTTPLKIEPALGGELHMPPEEIISIEGDRFAFTDGTALKGQIKGEILAVKTGFGDLTLPVAQLKALKSGKEATAVTPTSGTVFEMKDGDVIVGELSALFKIKTALVGELAVPPEEIESIEGERVNFTDGTMLTARTNETFAVTTRFGELNLSVIQFKTIKGRRETRGVTPTNSSIFELKTGDVVRVI